MSPYVLIWFIITANPAGSHTASQEFNSREACLRGGQQAEATINAAQKGVPLQFFSMIWTCVDKNVEVVQAPQQQPQPPIVQAPLPPAQQQVK